MALKHILLGILREPATGYDLKKAFNESLRHFWNANLSQIYPVLQRMENDGLLTSTREPSPKGPDRRVYQRTEAGRNELEAWLCGEPMLADVRIHYLAQIFFMDALDDLAQTSAFLRRLRAAFAQQMAGYQAVEAQLQQDSPDRKEPVDEAYFHPYLTLRYGILRMQANIEWCEEAIRLVEDKLAEADRTSDKSPSKKS